jgi:hypothetical protein
MSQSLDQLDDRALVKLALENRQEAYTRCWSGIKTGYNHLSTN